MGRSHHANTQPITYDMWIVVYNLRKDLITTAVRMAQYLAISGLV